MAASINRIKRDMRELTGIEALEKKISAIEKENENTRREMRDLRREVAVLNRALAAMGPGGERVKSPLIIEVIEELVRGMEQPVKVVDLRDALIRDGRVRSKAENFYSVIVTAMNHSDKFEKISSGMYRYLGG